MIDDHLTNALNHGENEDRDHQREWGERPVAQPPLSSNEVKT
jgi:hypothetical protein